MKKNKIALLITSVLIISVVGMTAAWYSSSDELTNKFSASGVSTDDSEDGVKVKENEEWTDEDEDNVYENEEAKNIVPGTEVNKDVQAVNTATYKSFIRMKISAKFTKTPLSNVAIDTLNEHKEYLELQYANLTDTTTLEKEKWVDGGDGYYYYLAVVDPDGITEKLLDSVTLSLLADNRYKNSEFEVVVEAEGIQASNHAAGNEWLSADISVLAKLAALEGE